MKKLYVEDCLDNQEKLKSILIPELERRLKNNLYYKFYIDNGLEIIESLDPYSDLFYIFKYVVTFEGGDGWEMLMLESTDGPISPLLEALTKDYGLAEVVEAHKEVFTVVKEVVDENTLGALDDSGLIETYYDKLNLIFMLKKKVEKLSGWEAYWDGDPSFIDLNLQIPRCGIILTIPNEEIDKLQVESDQIYLPYNHKRENAVLIESYFNDLDLLGVLKNYQLQNVFSSDIISDEGMFISHLKEVTTEVFNHYEGEYSDLPEKFRKANKSVNFLEIVYSSGVFKLPTRLFESANGSTWAEGYTSLIKTESGVYYLKDDKVTIGFQTLKETYDI